jgi:HEPN domain-containing protein
MKRPIDLARRFLELADRDIKTFHLLADIPDSDNAAVGFHAQQAVEKCLKAVLSRHEIPFRKTHNLDELIDLLKDHGKKIPPNADGLELLNPFAVTLRYDLIELETLDRDQAREVVGTLRRWAEEQIR